MAFAGAGSGEQKALHLVTARQPQQHPLVLGFNALDQYRRAQCPGKGHDRLNDHASIGGSAERRDEAFVDLELVQRKALKIAQVGIAGAEVVQGDSHTQGMQIIDALGSAVRIGNYLALSTSTAGLPASFMSRMLRNIP